MCFTSGMFPDILKQAEICPIFKKGDAMNVCNYGPVSILPIVAKVYEKEMVRQLENYFEDILSPYISGFRKTHSCETVLIRPAAKWPYPAKACFGVIMNFYG